MQELHLNCRVVHFLHRRPEKHCFSPSGLSHLGVFSEARNLAEAKGNLTKMLDLFCIFC